ncbi:MAG: hypothetical protein ACQKBY_10600 [Verrucomicrobiales bacterium]
MSETKEIVCRPTSWFYWRVLLILAMFAGFSVYFFYDYKVGYPKKNLIWSHFRAFYQAGELYKALENKAQWPEFVKTQAISFEVPTQGGKGESGEQFLLPAGTEREQPWPEILGETERMEKEGWDVLWREYAGERPGWPEHLEIGEGYYTGKKVREQLYFGILCGALALGALFVFLRTRGRTMKVDDEAFEAAGGPRIPFSAMTKIDKRKWETKGLATIYYEGVEGQSGKAKVDGMVYGQFKEEEGAPAEALFQRILTHFSGDLIELSLEDEEDEADEESAGKKVEPAAEEAGG